MVSATMIRVKAGINSNDHHGMSYTQEDRGQNGYSHAFERINS